MTEYNLSRAVWRKSSRSQQNGACVEVAGNLPGIVAVRDSKDPEGSTLIFAREAWRGFARCLKGHDFDL